MKIFIYFILIIAFLMFYQQNPVFAIIIVVLLVGIFLFFKSRKSHGMSAPGSFLSGSRGSQTSNMDNIVNLLLLQQTINSGAPIIANSPTTPKKISKRKEQLEKTKQEIIALLES